MAERSQHTWREIHKAYQCKFCPAIYPASGPCPGPREAAPKTTPKPSLPTHEITTAQRKVIGFIQDNLGIEFHGASMSDARDWISKHIAESKAARRHRGGKMDSPKDHDDLREDGFDPGMLGGLGGLF